jgi:hypothetical protein
MTNSLTPGGGTTGNSTPNKPSTPNNGDNNNSKRKLLRSVLRQSVKIANQQLVSINVNNKGLGDARACCLAAALSACPNLTSLGLAGNRLTDVSIDPLLKALFSVNKIMYLDMSDNKLDSKAISVFQVLEVSAPHYESCLS